jgi:hypothetical protein
MFVVDEPATVGPDGAPQAVNIRITTNNPIHTVCRSNQFVLTKNSF